MAYWGSKEPRRLHNGRVANPVEPDAPKALPFYHYRQATGLGFDCSEARPSQRCSPGRTCPKPRTPKHGTPQPNHCSCFKPLSLPQSCKSRLSHYNTASGGSGGFRLLFPVIIGIVVLLCSCVYQCHQHYHDFRPYQINYQHKHPAPPPPHHLLRTIHVLRRFDPGQVGVMMSPEEADRLGLKPFGDGGAENETSPRLGATGPFWSLRRLRRGGGGKGGFRRATSRVRARIMTRSPQH